MRVLRYTTLATACIAFFAYIVVFGRPDSRHMLHLFLYTTIPLVVTALLAAWWRTFWGQAILLATTAAYAAWMVFMYVGVMILHPDPLSPLGLLFAAAYAWPVLIVLWIVGGIIEWKRRAH